MIISKISPKIGAIIEGINLNTELTENIAKKIRDLLIEHQVIFFKKQPELTEHEYMVLVKKLWKPMSHPFISDNKPIVPGISPFQPYQEYPEITGVYHSKENKGNLNDWHSDLNWLANPSYGSVLRARVIPKIGGDTLFASMTAAYEDLSDEMKSKIDNMYAYHDFMQIYKGIFGDNIEAENKMRTLYPPQAHPVVLKHPLSGKKSIFVNRVSTTRIEGLPEAESKKLLLELYKCAFVPEYQVRYQWTVNDIAIWDNLATQHYAVSDYWPENRKMERISLAALEV